MQENKSRTLIQECRQIMTRRMRSSLTAMLNEVDEKLHTIAQSRMTENNEAACYEAIREIRMKRVEIKTRFERRFINLFDGELQFLSNKGELTEEKREELSNSGAHAIVTPSMEKSLSNIKQECSKTLLELDRKLSCLLDTPARLNPLQPEIVYEAFREACWDIKSGDEIRKIMFEVFEKRVNEDLKNIYSDINSLLEKSNEGKNQLEEDKTVDIMQDSESRESLLRYRITERIESRINGHKVPHFVRSFLLKHWRCFLEDVYRKYSENSIAWNAAQQTMDDLIWLTNTDCGYYDRQNKIQLLPSLLFRLLNGMQVIAMPDDEISLFLSQLKQFQLKSLDSVDKELLDTITESAIESAERDFSRVRH